MVKGIDFVGVSVVYFCHDGKGNFVMGKRSQNARDEHGKWDIGGRGVEVLVSVEKTLEKEIMEEYCTEITHYEFLGFRDVFRNQADKVSHWVALDFKVSVNSETVKNGEPHKMEEVKWFNRQSMPSISECHSQWGFFLEKYKDKLWS